MAGVALLLLVWAANATPANAANVWYEYPNEWLVDDYISQAWKDRIGVNPEITNLGGRWEPMRVSPTQPPYAYRFVYENGRVVKTISVAQYQNIRASLIAGGREFAGRPVPGTMQGLGDGHYSAGHDIFEKIRTMEGPPKYGNQWRAKLHTILNKLGHWPHWRVFGAVGAATMAFDFGWKIGSWFIKMPGSPLYTPTGGGSQVATVTNWTKVEKGDPLATSGVGSGSPEAPSDGWQALFSQGGQSRYSARVQLATGEGSCTTYKVQLPESPAATSTQWIPLGVESWGTTGGCAGYGSTWGLAMRAYGPVAIEPYTGQTTQGNFNLSPTTEPSLSAQEAAADDVLQKPGYGPIGEIAHNEAAKEGLLGENDDLIEEEDDRVDVVIVPVAGPREHYSDYGERLAARGLEMVAQPGRLRQRVESKPDGTVIKIRPTAGSKARSGSEVRVTYNPSESEAEEDPEADPDQGTTGWAPPNVRDVDFSPISQALSCNVFPFGLFCWAHQTLGGFQGSGECPTWTVEFTHGDLDLDPCVVEPIMPVIRTMITLAVLVGFVMLVGGFAMGGGSRGSD